MRADCRLAQRLRHLPGRDGAERRRRTDVAPRRARPLAPNRPKKRRTGAPAPTVPEATLRRAEQSPVRWPSSLYPSGYTRQVRHSPSAAERPVPRLDAAQVRLPLEWSGWSKSTMPGEMSMGHDFVFPGSKAFGYGVGIGHLNRLRSSSRLVFPSSHLAPTVNPPMIPESIVSAMPFLTFTVSLKGSTVRS